MRRLFGVVAVLATAMLVVPALAAAQAPTGDYASGFGFWQSDDDFGPGSVGFEAINNVVPDGEFDYREQGTGNGFHARVTCLDVDGNQAFMRLVVERSTYPGVAPLDELFAYAEDNGDGRNDRFELDDEEGSVFDPCGASDDDSDPIRGNIYLADEGAFARS